MLSSLHRLNQNERSKYENKIKSIKKKQVKDGLEEKEKDEEYDSADSENSIDQLLDDNFIPNKSKPDHMKNPIASKSRKLSKHDSPRKYIKSSLRTAGSKRAKAMMIMASNKKKSNKKQYNKIRKELNYRNTPKRQENKDRKRRVLTPNITSTTEYNDNLLIITPKKVNKYKNIETPLTPTPVKLMRKLNVKTPMTMKKHLNISSIITPRPISKLSSLKPSSWKDIEYTPTKNNHNISNKNKNKNKNNKTDFESLVSMTRILPLPIKWNILLEKFNALESTLALKMRKNTFFVHYQNIETSVRTICKKRFLSQDLQQILTIVPDFYHIQWTPNLNKLTNKKELKLTLTAMDYDPYNDQQINSLPLNDDIHKDKEKEQEKDDGIVKKVSSENETTKEKLNGVGIKFLKVSKLKERENVFRLRLIKYVKYYHQKWLNDNIIIEFDPFQTRKWHKRFDLENITDITSSPLPLKPTKDIDQIEKMIIAQKQKLEEIMKNNQLKLKQSKEDIKNGKNNKNDDKEIPHHLKHLSPTLIAKIRAKQENKLIKDKVDIGKNGKNGVKNKKCSDFEDEYDKMYRSQQLPYLVNLVRGIYVSLKKSSMSCNDLINQIKKRHRNHHILNEEIWKQLQLLNGLKSRFFKIKQGPMIKVAKLSKKVSTKDVLDEINKGLK